MARRIVEIMLGSVIAFCLIANYSDKTNGSQLLIWYLFTPSVMKVIVWLLLFFIAGRLIFGTYQDYSKHFYNLLNKFWTEPKKTKKAD